MSTTTEQPAVRNRTTDDVLPDRLRRRAERLQEGSFDWREWAREAPGPLASAMRRRAAELDLNSVALSLAADGVRA